MGSRVFGLVSLVKDYGVHVVLGDGKGGLGHQGAGLGRRATGGSCWVGAVDLMINLSG